MATKVEVRIGDPSEAGVEYYGGLEHLDSDRLKIRRRGSPEVITVTVITVTHYYLN
jgi:type I restriction enzyme S subunit